MNELEIIGEKRVEDLIYVVRGKEVMLARDVARLYQVDTFRINEVVKRNKKRFPEEFCFQLTKEETESICSRSQFEILNNQTNKRGSNVKYLPYVFTEHGVMMLSGLLKSDIAALVNIKIINAFIAMRKILNTENLGNRITNIEQKMINMDNHLEEHNKQIEKLFDKFQKEENTHLFFDGKIYDAYSLLKDIFNKAKKEIIIIDNYIDKSLLDILRELNGNIIIFTKNISKLDVEKYRKQYHNIKIYIINDFHDRFIILDKEILYHSGASFKDLGKKCFAINKLDSKEILYQLLEKIKEKRI